MEKVDTPVISANWVTNQNSISSCEFEETPDAVIKIEDGEVFKEKEVDKCIQRVKEGKDRVAGLKELISSYVLDMTNFNLKSRLLSLCVEVEHKDSAMLSSGKTIVETLRRCVWSLHVDESEIYPTDSLHNIMKNLEVLALDIEDKVESIQIPDKHHLLDTVQQMKREAEDRNLQNQKLKEQLAELRAGKERKEN